MSRLCLARGKWTSDYKEVGKVGFLYHMSAVTNIGLFPRLKEPFHLLAVFCVYHNFWLLASHPGAWSLF